MKISQVFKDFKGRKGSQVDRRSGRRQDRGAKGVASQMSPAPADTRHYGTLPWASREGRTVTWPYLKSHQTEPEFEFFAKRRWSVSNPQFRLRSFVQIPVSGTRGLEKRGRIGRAKDRKDRGKGKGVNKVSCSLSVGALWPVVRIRRRPGTKGSQLRPLGLVHWQASWPLSTPNGQDVSRSEEESPPESPFVAGRGTPSRAPDWALV